MRRMHTEPVLKLLHFYSLLFSRCIHVSHSRIQFIQAKMAVMSSAGKYFLSV